MSDAEQNEHLADTRHEGRPAPDRTPEERAGRLVAALINAPLSVRREKTAAEIRAAVEREREACAKLCEEADMGEPAVLRKHADDATMDADEKIAFSHADRLAEEIRARAAQIENEEA